MRRPSRVPPWNREAPDAAFLQAVREDRVPRDEWTHRKFLRLAFLVLREQGPDAPQVLTAELERFGGAEVHRTVTHAWLAVLAGSGAQFYAGDFRDFLADHPGLLDQGYLRRFFSPGRLHAEEARTDVVEPDRDPLPRPGALVPASAGVAPPGRVMGPVALALLAVTTGVAWALLAVNPGAVTGVPALMCLAILLLLLDGYQAPVPVPPPPPRLEVRAGADTACPYCADPLDRGAVVSCRRCHTPHHHDCWRDGQGCTTFGCGAGVEERDRA